MLKSALGKVLFVDEAYRFCDGGFGNEAVNELIDNLTRPEYMGKMVVILAGYNDDMNKLLAMNPGLSSRFPEEIQFHNMKTHECLSLLERNIQQNGIIVNPISQDSGSSKYQRIIDTFTELSKLSSWGNGRDVKTLAKSVSSAVLANTSPEADTLTATADDILQALEAMLDAQRARSEGSKNPFDPFVSNNTSETPPQLTTDPPAAPSFTTATNTATENDETTLPPDPMPHVDEEPLSPVLDAPPQRDPGVSDETWHCLQNSIAAANAEQAAASQFLAAQEQAMRECQAEEDVVLAETKRLETLIEHEQHQQRVQELQRQIEKERLRAQAALQARLEAEERRRRAMEEQESKQRREEAVQQRIRELDVCPAGFQWAKEGNGYRCGGGGHFLTNELIGIE
jgi:hypothetical protein